MGRTSKVFGASLVSVVLLAVSLVFLSGSAHAADEEEGTTRAIAIAYDNSGSMITRSDKWCGAKYSLEVLAAMLNTNDTLVLYTMESTGQKLSLSGSQDVKDRVAAIHDADLGASGWTEPRTAQEAYEYLVDSSAQEKYLVITSDGEFNTGNGIADVERTVERAAADGITVVYLAIGADADVIDLDAGNNVFVKIASSENILSTMTEVANQIFGRVQLPDSAFDSEAGKLVLEVPMAQVIVFAQGENVQVGDLLAQDGDVVSGKTANVKYSEVPTEDSGYTEYEINTKLQGVVATYATAMPAGEYDLDIANADSVEIYYKPYVDISVGLIDEGGIEYTLAPGSENKLSAGVYDASYTLLDPFTGEPVDSDLLYPAVFGMKVEAGGEVQTLAEDDQLTVSTGAVTIIANAETKGGAKAHQTYRNIDVSPALAHLVVDASSLSTSLEVVDFGKASYQIEVSKEGGSSFTAEEWGSLVLTIEDPTGVNWRVEKLSDYGLVQVSPQYVDGDQWETQKQIFGSTGVSSKTVELGVTASAENMDNVYAGSAKENLTYGPNLASAIIHALPWLVALLLLVLLAYLYATKPRLPRKMRPHLEFGNEDVQLTYSEAKIENKYSPLGPERVSFAISPRQSSDRTHYSFSSRFALGSISLVAVKKERGKRRFRLADSTIQAMHKYTDQAADGSSSRFPPPEFSPLPSLPSKKGGKRTTTFSSASSIGFTGWGRDIPGVGKRPMEYRLRFK